MFVGLNRHIKMCGNMRVKRLKILEPTLKAQLVTSSARHLE